MSQILARTKIDKLCWIDNIIGNICIDIDYAKYIINCLNIDRSAELIGDPNEDMIRRHFAPSTAIKWYLLDDPIIDYYYYRYEKRGIEIRTSTRSSRGSELGMAFEKSIHDGLREYTDIKLIDLEDIPMNRRLTETIRCLDEGYDVILNGLVVGMEHGIYGAPDVIMRKKCLSLLDRIMDQRPANVTGEDYIIIEIKYSPLKVDKSHQSTSRRMRFYQGQAHLYALALQEMLSLRRVPESYILPRSINRSKVPVMGRRYGSIVYRNNSCVPVDQHYIHGPLMEALAWNVFISEYCTHIDPLYMFIANTSNKYGEEYSHVKRLHALRYGALELYMDVQKVHDFRRKNIFTIHDPRVRSGDVLGNADVIDFMRLDILRTPGRHHVWIRDMEMDILRTTREQIVVYMEDDVRYYVVDGVPKSSIYIRQHFDNSVFIVFNDSDIPHIHRIYGHTNRQILVVSIQSILNNSLIVIPGLYAHDIGAFSGALSRNGIIDVQVDFFISEFNEDRIRSNAMVMYNMWMWLRSLVSHPTIARVY